MTKIPRDKNFDASLAILRKGYNFAPERFVANNNHIFSTRLMLQKIIFITGPEAAMMFYGNTILVRKTAMPKRIQKTLVGVGGVQTLDHEKHLNRKAMFMSLMSEENIQKLLALVDKNIRDYKTKWQSQTKVALWHEMKEILCISACEWVGLPLKNNEISARASKLSTLFESFGVVGLYHWRGRINRKKLERWISNIIRDVKAGKINIAEDSAFHKIIAHHDSDGIKLDAKTASVEVLNIVRPIVAIATYISFGMHALNENPKWCGKVDDNSLEIFVQEMRRYYPFTPFVGARVAQDFEWQGYQFKKGNLVALDVYYMNHNPELWEKPEDFNPARFNNKEITPYNFIPQGGGEHHLNHRCAGEWITIEVIKLVLNFMSKEVNYKVPPQNLGIDLSRIPTRVKSNFIICNVT